MKLELNDEAMVVGFLMIVTLWLVLFSGDPDLVDALIQLLTKSSHAP